MVDPISHITTGDIPFDDSAFRNIITKKYETWVVKHHPDKVKVTNPADEFIIKENGVTLLQNDDDNDDSWRNVQLSFHSSIKYPKCGA